MVVSGGSRISQTEGHTPGFGSVTSQSHVRACAKLGSLGFQRTALQLQTGQRASVRPLPRSATGSGLSLHGDKQVEPAVVFA